MKVVLLGGTGAMGVSLSRELAELGADVHVTTRRERAAKDGISFVKGNAKDEDFLKELLDGGKFDVVVDFMKWTTPEFRQVVSMLLASTGQYMYLSSYRVYAEDSVLVEGSPRLLDVCGDAKYLQTDEYALAKARGEDMLVGGDSGNWTIVRPAITYSGKVARLQLGSMEAGCWLWRAAKGMSIPIPSEMLEKTTTMTYGGDVAKMIARLVGNPNALGNDYIVSTSESVTWRQIADWYSEIIPLDIVNCSLEDYIRAIGNRYRVIYDRMFDRRVDNAKVLGETGLSQSDMTPTSEGIKRELKEFLDSDGLARLAPDIRVNGRLDRIMGRRETLSPIMADGVGMKGFMRYWRSYLYK